MTTNWLKQLPLAMLLRVSAMALILSLSALAQGGGNPDHGGGGGGDHGGGHGGHHGGGGGGGGGGGHGGGNGAPEINGGLAAAGLALLAGGTLILTSRRRPKTA